MTLLPISDCNTDDIIEKSNYSHFLFNKLSMEETQEMVDTLVDEIRELRETINELERE